MTWGNAWGTKWGTMPLAGTRLEPRQVFGLLYDNGWKGDNLLVMTAVVLAESDGFTEAVGGPNGNGTYDWGVFQLNSGHVGVTKEMAFDPHLAAKYARMLFTAEGFGPWYAYTTGTYKTRMLKAIEGQRNFYRQKYGYQIV